MGKTFKAEHLLEPTPPPENCECQPQPGREWRSYRNDGVCHKGFKYVQYLYCTVCGANTGGVEPVVTSWDKDMDVPPDLLHYFVGLTRGE